MQFAAATTVEEAVTCAEERGDGSPAESFPGPGGPKYFASRRSGKTAFSRAAVKRSGPGQSRQGSPLLPMAAADTEFGFTTSDTEKYRRSPGKAGLVSPPKIVRKRSSAAQCSAASVTSSNSTAGCVVLSKRFDSALEREESPDEGVESDLDGLHVSESDHIDGGRPSERSSIVDADSIEHESSAAPKYGFTAHVSRSGKKCDSLVGDAFTSSTSQRHWRSSSVAKARAVKRGRESTRFGKHRSRGKRLQNKGAKELKAKMLSLDSGICASAARAAVSDMMVPQVEPLTISTRRKRRKLRGWASSEYPTPEVGADGAVLPNTSGFSSVLVTGLLDRMSPSPPRNSFVSETCCRTSLRRRVLAQMVSDQGRAVFNANGKVRQSGGSAVAMSRLWMCTPRAVTSVAAPADSYKVLCRQETVQLHRRPRSLAPHDLYLSNRSRLFTTAASKLLSHAKLFLNVCHAGVEAALCVGFSYMDRIARSVWQRSEINLLAGEVGGDRDLELLMQMSLANCVMIALKCRDDAALCSTGKCPALLLVDHMLLPRAVMTSTTVEATNVAYALENERLVLRALDFDVEQVSPDEAIAALSEDLAPRDVDVLCSGASQKAKRRALISGTQSAVKILLELPVRYIVRGYRMTAIGCVALAKLRQMFGADPWPDELAKITGIDRDEMMLLVRELAVSTHGSAA